MGSFNLSKTKKIVLPFLVLFLLISLSACKFNCMKPQEVENMLDNIAGNISQSQITEDKNLIGKRNSQDYYTGQYNAKCENQIGRDVVFGGGSLKEKSIKISGTIKTEKGKATIRVRQNEDVKEYSVNNDEVFVAELSLENGGNYIMIDYDDFSGTVQISSEYSK